MLAQMDPVRNPCAQPPKPCAGYENARVREHPGVFHMVGLAGLEPATFRPPDGRATRLRHSPLQSLLTVFAAGARGGGKIFCAAAKKFSGLRRLQRRPPASAVFPCRDRSGNQGKRAGLRTGFRCLVYGLPAASARSSSAQAATPATDCGGRLLVAARSARMPGCSGAGAGTGASASASAASSES